MKALDLYNKWCLKCSRITTKTYSTSFSIGISLLDKSIRDDIYALYGFVRLGDEIVDTLHDFPKHELIEKFYEDTFAAITMKVSANPILHSFQKTVNKYNIEDWQISAFLKSMKLDTAKNDYDQKGIDEYILGSAQVVGLMCLKVFCKNDSERYEKLSQGALELGAAFQKINFLRDVKIDRGEMGRNYFPSMSESNFNDEEKAKVELEIEDHLEKAYADIFSLPAKASFSVYVAYIYYKRVFGIIKKTPAAVLMKKRVRISNFTKVVLILVAKLKFLK